MSKKLMILGAGVYQVPLIKKAKEMGIYTIVVSIHGNYPGFAIADKIYYEDTTNYDKVLEIARKEQIDGIVTTGTDVAVVTIGKVCDELKLSGLSFEAAQIASNKMLMKRQYEEYGVRTAKFRKVSFDLDDIKIKIEGLNYPLIFKAVDTSGSRGIIRVDSEEDFLSAYEVVRQNTKKDYFIIEEFLIGEEFGAQAFIYRGNVEFILPHGDYVFTGDTGVPVGHWAPFELEQSVIEDTKEQLKKAAEAMHLDNCAINADFMLCRGQAYVLELGGRCGATCLAETVSLYFGFDYYEKIILASLGEEVDFASKSRVCNVAMLLKSEKTGKIIEQKNENDMSDPDIYDIQFDYNIGDTVQKFHVGPHRIGHVIVKGKNIESAKKKLDQVMNNITIEVK